MSATLPRREPPALPCATTLPDPGEMDPAELKRWDDTYTLRYCFDWDLTPAEDEHWRAINDRLLFAGIPETPAQQAVRALIARDLRRATA